MSKYNQQSVSVEYLSGDESSSDSDNDEVIFQRPVQQMRRVDIDDDSSDDYGQYLVIDVDNYPDVYIVNRTHYISERK